MIAGRIIEAVRYRVLLTGAMVVFPAVLSGCAMNEPLATEHLQVELKDPGVSIVLLRYKAPGLPPAKTIFGAIDPLNLPWSFAVANESTGWNFRRLGYNMIFRTRDDAMEPDTSGAESGWVVFLAPPGSSYIAVRTLDTGAGDGQSLVATPFPDRISVGHSADRVISHIGRRIGMIDHIDTPRFSVRISQPRSLIYAGTIMRNTRCGKEQKLSECPYDLTVVDESELAKSFVSRYPGGFAIAAPMQTQLLAIPQSRTIEIRSKPEVPGQPRQ